MSELHSDADRNRELWTRTNAAYTDARALEKWAQEEIDWGIWGIPERELGLLGDVAGLDVIELGCGTGYVSAWLARRGARRQTKPSGKKRRSSRFALAFESEPCTTFSPRRVA